MRRVMAITAVGAVLLGACGGYSDEFRADFLDACLQSSGGDIGYCECVIDHLEANGPDDENDITVQDQAEAITACAGEVRG